jgi:hypothetical protein
LGEDAHWVGVDTQPIDGSGRKTVVIHPTADTQFYRLRK